jgi:hypothetical protein
MLKLREHINKRHGGTILRNITYGMPLSDTASKLEWGLTIIFDLWFG